MANRLEKEDSPYLQQHKNNPVDWFAWRDEAFKKAKDENKAIFISIGYSSCHWCHVMEEKVFENEEFAKKLNSDFVCIKVDKEERPDIDKYYQEVHKLLNRTAGGWPTSIFCTPENKPFFAGTYIAPESRDKQLGFGELIDIISKKIDERETKLFSNADEILEYMKPDERPKEATKLLSDLYKNYLNQAEYNFEEEFGGFSIKPKFPHYSTLLTLLHIAQTQDDKRASKFVKKSLDSMILGGMYDLVDGGFCRYSTDQKWLVPHFEKMTYDNGLLIELYTKAYEFYKDEKYLNIAKKSADFMFEKMSENKLYYSASDADSKLGEGDYFTYTYNEVEAELKKLNFTDTEIKEYTQHFNISKDGNFEDKNIIRVDDNKKLKKEKEVLDILKKLREKREYPFIDKKVQTSWSSMIIKALFRLSSVDKTYFDQAMLSIGALEDKMIVNNKLQHSSLISSSPKVEAFLEDYAYAGVMYVEAYETSLDEMFIIKATHMANQALEKFYDKGRWFFSKGEFEVEAELTDSTYPSSVGVIVDLLNSLGSLVDDKYSTFAFKTLEYYSKTLARAPISMPYLFDQAYRYTLGIRVIKANEKNLRAIKDISYPFAIKKLDTSDEILICSNQACFTNLKDTDKVDEELIKTL